MLRSNCHIQHTPVLSHPDLTALCDGCPALCAYVVLKTRILDFPIDSIKFNVNAVSLAITASSTAQDSDSKLMHCSFNMILKEIHGLQDELACFVAVFES